MFANVLLFQLLFPVVATGTLSCMSFFCCKFSADHCC
uniref:Uncharacterized protein n=1 Tax=Rhizophora mucronata TaxID=61149 RepID=A0A2P2NCX3_RHIMU